MLNSNTTNMERYWIKTLPRLILLGACLVSFGTAAFGGQVVCPPAGSNIVFQTNGPNGSFNWGDWWTNTDPDAGNQPHMFEIYVTSVVDSDFTIQVELYDPESYQTGTELDELHGAGWDDATFTLMAPDGATQVAQQVFPPVSGTSEQWNSFASFTVRNYGVGIYRLYVSTSDDDENAYSIRIVEGDPDAVADSGDEINIAPVKTSFQHLTEAAGTYYFYVGDTTELRLSNFDMDQNGSVAYTDPSSSSTAGTVSGMTTWNNGGGAAFPPPGGDVFSDPLSGWWQTDITVTGTNQYIFYAENALFIENLPHYPVLNIDKDDGASSKAEGDDIFYTLIVSNTGTGPALNATVTDTLPTGTSFVDATGDVTYTYDDPYSIVTWNMGTLVPGALDTVYLTIHVEAGAVSPIQNWAHVTHSDVFFNTYTGINDDDEDIMIPVELSSFTASASYDRITLTWITQSETENLGFNILRSENDNNYQRINATLIEGKGTSAKAQLYSFEDNNVTSGNTYYYILQDVDFNGNSTTHGPVSATVPLVPDQYSLGQNYPNPFNPSTSISYTLKADGLVKLAVYNMVGQQVKMLVNQNQTAGTHIIEWNGTDDNGNIVPTGMYIYMIEVNGFEQTHKMMFMR